MQEFLKKAGSDKIKAEINKQIVEAQTKLLDIETKRENEVISALQDNRNKRLKIEEQCYITQKTELEKAVAKQAITEEHSPPPSNYRLTSHYALLHGYNHNNRYVAPTDRDQALYPNKHNEYSRQAHSSTFYI